MADPTALIVRDYEVATNRYEFLITNAEPLVVGGLAGFDTNAGTVEFPDPTNVDIVPCGIVEGSYDGDNANLTGDGVNNKAICAAGLTLRNVNVTNVAAASNIGDLVYATDGQIMALTQFGAEMPIGHVIKWYSGTECDVYLFTFAEAILHKNS